MEADLAFVKTVLQKEAQDRTYKEVKRLNSFLLSIEFIQEQTKLLDSDTMQQMLSALKYEDCHKGHALFEYGDIGVTFYIIIAGEVEIRVPTQVELEGGQATPEGLVIFLVTYYDSICWESLTNGHLIK